MSDELFNWASSGGIDGSLFKSHTEGKLKADGMYVVSQNSGVGTLAIDLSNSALPRKEVEDSAKRIAACWNACKGIKTASLEKLPIPLIEILKGASRDYDRLAKLSVTVLMAFDRTDPQLFQAIEELREELRRAQA